jgi:putative endopeptidase
MAMKNVTSNSHALVWRPSFVTLGAEKTRITRNHSMQATKKLLASAVALALMGSQSLAFANTVDARNPAQANAPSMAQASLSLSGVDINALDRAVRPQDDFYQFANGGWLNSTAIPEIYSGYTIYHEVYEDAEQTLRGIIESSAASPQKPGTEAQKVGDIYAGWMDEASVEARGLSPLKGELAAIDKVTNSRELPGLWASFSRQGLMTPLALFVYADLKDSSQYAAYVYQNGLTLPDRDYYLDADNANFAKISAELPVFIHSLVSFVDPGMSEKRAKAVYQLEHSLAEHQWSKVENRDDHKTYNAFEIKELGKLGSNLDWQSMLADMGLGKVERLIISQPSYVQALDKLLGEVSLQTWKDYMRYNLVRGYAEHLSQDVAKTRFAFMNTRLNGQAKQEPRWKRGVTLVNESLGEAVGKLYVEQRFPAEAKDKMNELVANVLAVFDDSIDKLEWMSEETRKAAKVKRAKFSTKIGYPEKWRDYSALAIDKGDHFGNVKRSREFEYELMLDKLGKPIDKHEWFMTPQTVNAYYDPTQNEIVFPAARLQSPFFQLQADDAINYGAIGGVIGHEISHGFDDSGSKYDGDGNLRNWWSEADRKAFEQRTARLVQQYNTFSPIEGMTVNGELTLGENIGDLAGVTMAYRAYKRSLKGKEAPVIDGFTGEQRFFIGYAMSRKGKYKQESIISRLASDPHSPLEFRVNGVYRNLAEFHQAFDVKPGDGMYLAPEDRVQIW